MIDSNYRMDKYQPQATTQASFPSLGGGTNTGTNSENALARMPFVPMSGFRPPGMAKPDYSKNGGNWSESARKVGLDPDLKARINPGYHPDLDPYTPASIGGAIKTWDQIEGTPGNLAGAPANGGMFAMPGTQKQNPVTNTTNTTASKPTLGTASNPLNLMQARIG